MKILVDADACPIVIKEILFRAANRAAILTILVANSVQKIPASPYIQMLQVPKGFDVADHEIVRRVNLGDLVITADIPLAFDVLLKGALALNPRGEVYTQDSIRALLTMRDFMDQLRGSGLVTGGPNAFSHADRAAFANQLDKFINKYRASIK